MTERTWVLRDAEGCYHDGQGMHNNILAIAQRYVTSEQAQRQAQIIAASPINGPSIPFLFAIPIERETVRKVEEIEGPAELYVLRSGDLYVASNGYTDNISNALTHTVGDVLRSVYHDADPIPVRVTEEPGEWKVVEE